MAPQVRKANAERRNGTFSRGQRGMNPPGKRADPKAKAQWNKLLQDLKERDAVIAKGKAQDSAKGEQVFNAALDDVVEEYEAERILDSKTINGVISFYVLWKGYEFGSSTWEPKDNLSNSTELIDAFYKEYPTKPGGPKYVRRAGRPAGKAVGK